MSAKIQITEADIQLMVNKAIRCILKEEGEIADLSAEANFGKAFNEARKRGLKIFRYKGKNFGTRLKGETEIRWTQKMNQARTGAPLTPITNTMPQTAVIPQAKPDGLAPRKEEQPATLFPEAPAKKKWPTIPSSERTESPEIPAKDIQPVEGVMDMYMERVGFYGKTTISVLRYTNAEGEARVLPVIEDVDRGLSLKFNKKINKGGKVWGETAIPEGVYNVKLHRHAGSGIISRTSDAYIKKAWAAAKGYPFLQIGEEHDNGAFTEVLMHQGTSERSSAGCLIIGGPGNAPSQRFSSKETREGVCMLLNDTIPFKTARITITRTEGEFRDFAKDENNITASKRYINAFKQYNLTEEVIDA